MLILDAKNFVLLIHNLLSCELDMRRKHGALPPDMIEAGNAACNVMIGFMTELDLPHSIKIAKSRLHDADTAEKCHSGYEHLMHSVALELEERTFYGPLRHLEKYYDDQQLFGPEVFNAFPSANDDIYEAGACLALERGTACVMHLMRVLESGLLALAQTLGVGSQNDWGKYLHEIGKELDRRQKAAGARSADEQFYAEVAVHLGSVRVAQRNPTMHVDKSYSVERAEEILIAVRSFMKHLATRIKEQPLPSAP